MKASKDLKFLILGSDGLWNVTSNKEVVDKVAQSSSQSLMSYVNSLVYETIERWKKREELMDDITVIVVPLVEE